jgi:TetR/AcrR family transcriptional repressor of multidrug resistance operon
MLPFEQYQLICHNLWQFFIDYPEILLSKAQFDHLPPEALRNRRQDARQHVRPLVELFEQGRANGVIRQLPDEVLFCLGMEPYFALARQQLLGLVELDNACLEQIIEASWCAITTGQ